MELQSGDVCSGFSNVLICAPHLTIQEGKFQSNKERLSVRPFCCMCTLSVPLWRLCVQSSTSASIFISNAFFFNNSMQTPTNKTPQLSSRNITLNWLEENSALLALRDTWCVVIIERGITHGAGKCNTSIQHRMNKAAEKAHSSKHYIPLLLKYLAKFVPDIELGLVDTS